MLCAKPKAYDQDGEASYIVGLLPGPSVAISKSDWSKDQFHCDLFLATCSCNLDSECPKADFFNPLETNDG